MNETKELKPKSFRIDEETAEKFKQISAELGNNQQQTLSKLIESYEFQKGKVVLTQKKGEIETFEKYVTILTRMYMASLEDNQNLTETVQTEFEALLQSKDHTIITLHEKMKEMKEESEKSQEEAKECHKIAEELKTQNAQLSAQIKKNQALYEDVVEDKEKLIQALTQACESYKKDLESMEIAKLEKSSMATKYMQLQKENTAAEERYQALQNEYHMLKLQQERELLQKEMEYTKQIHALEEKRKQEIDEYQAHYFELLKQLREKSKPTRIVRAEIK